MPSETLTVTNEAIVTRGDTNAGRPLRQSYLIEQLTVFEDKLTHFLAAQRFYDQAIRAMTAPDYDDESSAKQWHLGLFLTQQWINDQGQQLMTDLSVIQHTVRN
ncbi:MAG: hypothetical protein ACRBEE_11110 [Arenicella sp.]